MAWSLGHTLIVILALLVGLAAGWLLRGSRDTIGGRSITPNTTVDEDVVTAPAVDAAAPLGTTSDNTVIDTTADTATTGSASAAPGSPASTDTAGPVATAVPAVPVQRVAEDDTTTDSEALSLADTGVAPIVPAATQVGTSSETEPTSTTEAADAATAVADLTATEPVVATDADTDRGADAVATGTPGGAATTLDADSTTAPTTTTEPVTTTGPASSNGPASSTEAASSTEPTADDQAAVEPTVGEDASDDEVADRRATSEPGVAESVATEPAAEEPAAVEPTPAESAAVQPAEERVVRTAEEPAAVEPVDVDNAGAEADDLRRIEGIGPKMATVLQAAGIQTYQQLAETDVDALRAAVRAGGARATASLPTWPQQARLLATGGVEADAAFPAAGDDEAGA